MDYAQRQRNLAQRIVRRNRRLHERARPAGLRRGPLGWQEVTWQDQPGQLRCVTSIGPQQQAAQAAQMMAIYASQGQPEGIVIHRPSDELATRLEAYLAAIPQQPSMWQQLKSWFHGF